MTEARYVALTRIRVEGNVVPEKYALKEALRGMLASILLERFVAVRKLRRIKLWTLVEGIGDSVSEERKVFCLEKRLG